MVRKRLAMVRGKNFHLEGVRIKKKLKEPAPIPSLEMKCNGFDWRNFDEREGFGSIRQGVLYS